MKYLKKLCSFMLILSILTTLFMGLTVHAATSSEPVVWLKFDDNLKDSSGKGYDGAEKDGTISYTPGVFGKAASFDHAAIELANTSAIQWNKSFSYSVWMKLDETVSSSYFLVAPKTGGGVLFDSYWGWGNTGITTRLNSVNKDDPEYEQTISLDTSSNIDSATNIEKFAHVVFTFDGKTGKFYIDGKVDKSSDMITDYDSSGQIFGQAASILVGGYDGEWLVGSVDDLRIYNTVLSATDVNNLYSEANKKGDNTMILTIDDPYMMVNKDKVELDPGRGTVPAIRDNRTVLPIANIIQTWGGDKPTWDNATRKVTLKYKGTTIELWIDKNIAKVNGVDTKIDEKNPKVVPFIENGRTMLPLSFVMKNFGIGYEWKGDVSQIHIFY